MPATKEEIQKFVFDAIVSFGSEPEDISLDGTLESLEVDSLDMVELAQMVEDEYHVQLEPQEFEGVTTVGNAVDVIAAKVSE
jgi:acyl carrier protein